MSYALPTIDRRQFGVIFWATKINVARRGGSDKADRDAARAQIERSFTRFGVPKIGCHSVHNVAGVPRSSACSRN